MDNLSRLLEQSALSLASIGFAALVGFRAKKLGRFDLVLAICLVAYVVVFCALSNMELFAFRLETFDRFVILPQIVFVFLVAGFFASGSPGAIARALVFVALVANAVVSYSHFSKVNDFSRNTIVEDWAINLLNGRKPGAKTVALVVTDTRYNAVLYAQQVLGVQPDILSIHPTMLLFKWYAKKAVAEGLVLDLDRLWREGDIRDVDAFIADNLKEFVVMTNLELSYFDKFQVTYLRQGKRVERGSGVRFLYEPTSWTERSKHTLTLTPHAEYDVFRDLWTDYGIFHFKNADWLHAQGRTEEARGELEKAVALVPWSLTSKANLCVLKKEAGEESRECFDDVERTAREYFTYY